MIPRLITHSFVVILALAAALASSVSIASTSRGSLGGRGFVAQWRGWEASAVLPTDAQRANLRTPSLARTRAASDDVAPNGMTFATLSTPEEPPAPAVVKRREIQEYEIKPGDTLSGIAEWSGISIDTLLWANDLKVSSLLQPGDKLKLLPVDGLLYQVKSGDSLGWVATHHNVSMEAITDYPENDLVDPNRLALGKVLVIPGAKKPAAPPPPPVMQASVRAPEPAPAPAPPARAANPNAGFVWPTYGPIFTYFGGYHAGLDISPPYGTPVVAAAAGVVTRVNRWNYSYGYHIIMDHGGGIGTLYGHLAEMLVGVGDSVAQGQFIGRVGNTGRSTGPHLHFEVHRNGTPVDPLGALPR